MRLDRQPGVVAIYSPEGSGTRLCEWYGILRYLFVPDGGGKVEQQLQGSLDNLRGYNAPMRYTVIFCYDDRFDDTAVVGVFSNNQQGGFRLA